MDTFLFDMGQISALANMLRIPALLAIAMMYAYFDLFNNRDIPDSIAYASVLVGLLFTLTLSVATIGYSILVAILVGSSCYLLYKAGQLGLGDGFEFVALSLILPLQPSAILVNTFQLGLPTILSIFVATGICAIILVPIYYLLIAKKSKLKEEGKGKNVAIKSLIMIFSYACLFLFITYAFGFNLISLFVISVVAIPSVAMVVYERRIMMQMIELIAPSKLDAGDMIALELMKKRDIEFFRKASPEFGKLASANVIAKISKIKRRIPVYKNAVPLALPTLVGVIVALLFGNLILLMI